MVHKNLCPPELSCQTAMDQEQRSGNFTGSVSEKTFLVNVHKAGKVSGSLRITSAYSSQRRFLKDAATLRPHWTNDNAFDIPCVGRAHD